MEKHAECPAREPKVAEKQVVRPKRVRGRYLVAQLGDAVLVREKVEQGEEDGKGLLHAEEAVEGPLAVELDDGVEVG